MSAAVDSDASDVTERAPAPSWMVVLAIGGLGAIVAALPHATTTRLVILVAVAAMGVAAIGAQTIRRRPDHPWVWWAFALGSTATAAAAVVAASLRTTQPHRARTAFLAFGLWGHLFLFAGFCGASRIRRRTGDISSVLDATILGLAISLIVWRTTFSTALHQSVVATPDMILVSLLPLVDVIACTTLLRRAFAAERTSSAFRMIGVAAGFVTAAQLVSGVEVLGGSPLTDQVPLQIGFLSLLAAAALHPSMRSVTEPEVITVNKFGATRIGLLALALLDLPLMILLDRGHPGRDNAPLLIGAFAMSAIVVIRLISLARETERTRQREKRREQRFESLVRNSSDLIVVLDDRYDATYVSPAVESVMGYPPARLLGRNALIGFHPEDVDRTRQRLDELVPDVPSDLELVRMVHSDGTWRWIEARAVNLVGDPTVNGIVVNCRDVTERVLTQSFIAASAARQSAVARLGRIALDAPDGHALTERAATLVRSTLDVQSCVVLLFEGAQITDAVISTAAGTGVVGADERPGEHIYEACLKAGEPIQFTDPDPAGALRVTSGLDFTPFDVRTERPERVVPDTSEELTPQVLAVQVADDGRVIGAVFARSGEPRCFTPDEAAFLATVAGTLGLALGRRGAEASAHHQALHDSLTGLPNRMLFVDRLDQALERTGRSGQRVAVLFLDIDHFKVINDSLGHSAGDRILTEVSARLTELIRSGDTVARFGGDEFTILLDPVRSRSEAERIAERIRQAVSHAADVDHTAPKPTISIGIAIATPGASDAETLLRDADAAMYQAKERGRDSIAVFDDTIRDRVTHRLRTEVDLPRAISEGELVMHYQPIVDLADGSMPGAEALVRWLHPTLGLIGPDHFIPIAELSGLIGDLDDWVTGQVMRECATFASRSAPTDRWYALNLSARSVAGTDLAERIGRWLADTGAPAERIYIEITESALMNDMDHSIAVLRELRNLGVKIAMDDFGTGYSSLAYLKRLPVTALKIDSSFIAGLDGDRSDRAIVQSVVELAATLGMEAIAEGVETPGQHRILTDLGCPLAQGFHFGRPVPAAELETARRPAASESGRRSTSTPTSGGRM